jgi:hypothetical protein
MTEQTERKLKELLQAGNELAAYNAIIAVQNDRLQTFVNAHLEYEVEDARQLLNRLYELREEIESDISCQLAGIEQEALTDFVNG